eukprot:TRINITY_DN2221_c0_g1_i3.p2 TRINITY_DN2221_c0_g1~~TRINITY_DN2221_c0_g1_i3.p2  ORF type:complete len:200 (-),score=37.37 TRINITY_DN2221_c0_g1_i3:4-603(-)
MDTLDHVLQERPELLLGAVSLPSKFALQSLFVGLAVVEFSSNAQALDWLTRGLVVAVAPLWTKTKPASVHEITTSVIEPLTTFFRKDVVNSCGDDELDLFLGEQCLPTSGSCTSQCSCAAGYHPQDPPQDVCFKDAGTHSHGNTVAIILGVVLSTLACVLVLLVVCAAVGVLVGVPLLRRKYRKEGATSFRNHFFGHRW